MGGGPVLAHPPPAPRQVPAGPSVLSALNTARPAVHFIPDRNEEQADDSDGDSFYIPLNSLKIQQRIKMSVYRIPRKVDQAPYSFM